LRHAVSSLIGLIHFLFSFPLGKTLGPSAFPDLAESFPDTLI